MRSHRTLARQVLGPLYDTTPTVQDSFFTRVAAHEGLDEQRHPQRANLVDRLKRLAGNAGPSFESLVGDGDAVEGWTDRMKNLRNNIGHGNPVPLHQSTAELYEAANTPT